jgi:hypothetical protein
MDECLVNSETRRERSQNGRSFHEVRTCADHMENMHISFSSNYFAPNRSLDSRIDVHFSRAGTTMTAFIVGPNTRQERRCFLAIPRPADIA